MYSQSGCIAERCHFSKGDKIDGRWAVDAFLGEGTFGQVFRVKDASGRLYALKLLKLWEVMASEREGLLKRFDREFETGQIPSKFLVHSLEKGNVRGNAYIVMEYCQGGDLFNAIKQSDLNLLLISSQILCGLRDLHQNGKVHRDLKPENVLLKDNYHAVLTDFGICGDQNNRLTQTGWSGVPKERFGTFAYMPPEQINPKRGNATVLPTTDIFSFGVMTYQLLTGRLPFGELMVESDLPRYINNGKMGIWDREAVTRLANGQLWLKVIEGCLKSDFKQRLQSTNDVLSLLPASPYSQNSQSVSFNSDARNGILLRVTQGEDQGKTYNLNELLEGKATLLTMGRRSEDVWNHIQIKEEESCYISRKHCTIEKDTQRNVWIIRDGQYRTNCPIGLRLHEVFPCRKCTAACSSFSATQQYRWSESLNGTYVNSHEVSPDGMVIKPGDIISIGDVKLRVEGA
jgi:serine/threonine protein kinase